MDAVEQKKHLVLSIIKFLQDELDKSDLTEEKKESVEVAIQCLETAYDTTNIQEENVVNLLSLIPSTSAKKVTDQQKLEAERCKNEGNAAIKNEQYTEALFFYTKAIDLNPYNAVYYCNRAAVYSKLDKHLEALKDSKEAIKLDPTYGKAYSRLGVAYSNLNMFEEARTAYKTALKHDPNNAMYENNLKLAEERLAQSQAGGGGVGGGGATGQVPVDLAQFFNNPALIGMATQMLNDPNFRNTILEFYNTNQMDNYNMDMLFQAGSALASRMNDVEGLRRSVNPQAPQDNSNPGEAKKPDEPQP